MKKLVPILALVLAMAMLLCACGNSPGGKTDALVVGVQGEPDSLYPPNSATGGLCLSPVYEPLIKYNYETGELEPCLAESWEYTDDTTLVFKLREDVKFSDGSDMTAEDVLFTFQMSMVETTQTYSKLSFIDIANCSVINDYTVEIKFVEPTASGPIIMSTTGIFSKAHYEAVGEDAMATQPLGTGAYAITEWKSGYSISYAKNEYYWGNPASFEEMTVRFYSEPTTLMIAYETGELDMALNISALDVDRIQNGEVKETQLFLTPTFESFVFTLYKGNPEVQDIRVRQAIAHAIDREAIAEHCLGVLGNSADSVMASSIQYYLSCDCYEYDPDKARALLAEAGVTDLHLTCLLENIDVITDMATIMQSQLKEVGITLDIESYDTGTVIPKWIGLENNMVPEGDCVIMAATLSVPDPDYRCTGYKQGSGLTIIEVSDTLNEMLFDARQTLDDAERQAKYEELQQEFVTEAFNVPLAEKLNAFVLREGLTGFSGYDPNGYDFYKVG